MRSASRFLLAASALFLFGCPSDDDREGTGILKPVDTGGPDTTPPDTYVPLGTLGAACDDNGDCESGLCAAVGPLGSICTEACTEGQCPDGYQCATSDAGSVCADARVANCQPCEADADCNRAGLSGNVCRSYGDEGSFCASSCEGDGDCPVGYGCDAGSCRFEGGLCACNAIGIALGAETACAVSNEHGSCEGSRGCGAGGLSRCYAETPAAEACDGRDNNCDGSTDEGLGGEPCDLENEFGLCKGVVRCAEGRPLCEGTAPAAEVCNGVDDDCDGSTDEGSPDVDEDDIADCVDDDWDNDGAKNPNDCEPYNAAVYPGQTEVCNGADDDCDRKTDEDVQAQCGCYTCGGAAGCLKSCDDDTDVVSGYVCDIGDFDRDGNRAECIQSSCGNGVLEAGEVCDDGENIGTYGGCFRCVTLAPRCGDGVRQFEREQCDDGLLNGQPGKCNSTCSGPTPTRCGNGVVESGEECDQGDGNSNAPNAACRLDCRARRCGDGVTDNGEQCDAGTAAGLTTCGCTAGCTFPGTTVSCRASLGVCDAAETCNGAGACPADAKLNGTLCRQADGTCDAAEYCDGTSNGCPDDLVKASTEVCRPAAGVCDAAETCTGQNKGCPADKLAVGTVCRPAAGVCDKIETCSGASAACPADAMLGAQTVCREGAGVCDPAERCDGETALCPANTFAEAQTACSDDPSCALAPCSCDGLGVCTSSCGDGELDEGELCDDGELNGARDRCADGCLGFCGGEPTWVDQGGGYGYDQASDIAVDQGGRSVAVGSYGEYYSQLPAAPSVPWAAQFGDFELANRGQDDVFVVAHGPQGDVEWASCAQGPYWEQAAGVALDDDGVWVAGNYERYITFACCDVQLPTAPFVDLECESLDSGDFGSDGAAEVFVARWDRTGNFQWALSGGADWTGDYATDVAADSFGHGIVVGLLGPTEQNATTFGDLSFDRMGGTDGFVAAFDRNGGGRLAVTLGGPGYDEALAVTVDAAGYIYVLLAFDTELSIGDQVLTPVGVSDVAIVKLDEAGGLVWAEVLGALEGLGDQYVQGVDIAYGCNNASDGALGCGVYVLYRDDVGPHVYRFGVDGQPSWKASIVHDQELYASALSVERNGRVTVTGGFTGIATFGAVTIEAVQGEIGPPVLNAATEGSSDVFVARLSADGDWLWARSFGGPGRDGGEGVGLDDAGAVYVTGDFGAQAAFGGQTLEPFQFDQPFFGVAPDAFVGKLVVPESACFACGDGEVDPGETCDESETSACAGRCNGTCDGPANNCGDGLAQCGEDYDLGGEEDPGMCTVVYGNAWCFELSEVDPIANNNFTLDPVRPGEPAVYGLGVLRENWNNPSVTEPGPFDGLAGNPNQLDVCPPAAEIGGIINHKALSAKQWGGDVVSPGATTEGTRLYCDGDPATIFPSTTPPASFAAGRNTLQAAIECHDYFEFVASTGPDVAFEFDNRAANQGPTNYALYVSLSGEDGTWGFVGRGSTFQAGDFGSAITPPMASFAVSDFVAPEGPVAMQPEVHFRLYAWGSSSVGDPWTLDNVRVGEPSYPVDYGVLFCFEETEDAAYSAVPTVARWNTPAAFSFGAGLTSPGNAGGPTTVFTGCPVTSSTQKAATASGWDGTAFSETSTDYFQVAVEPPAGSYELGFEVRRSNTGPTMMTVWSPELGTLQADIASPAGEVWGRYTVPFTTSGGPIQLRVFAYSAGGTGGTFRIDAISVDAVPAVP